VAEEPYLTEMLAKIKPDMSELKVRSDFGDKIYSKLVKNYPSLAVEGETAKKSKRRANKKQFKKGKKQGKQHQPDKMPNNQGFQNARPNFVNNLVPVGGEL